LGKEGRGSVSTNDNGVYVTFCNYFATGFDQHLNIMKLVNILSNDPRCTYVVIYTDKPWGGWWAESETGVGGHFLKAPILLNTTLIILPEH
jgi:hypothetical protein